MFHRVVWWKNLFTNFFVFQIFHWKLSLIEDLKWRYSWSLYNSNSCGAIRITYYLYSSFTSQKKLLYQRIIFAKTNWNLSRTQYLTLYYFQYLTWINNITCLCYQQIRKMGRHEYITNLFANPKRKEKKHKYNLKFTTVVPS